MLGEPGRYLPATDRAIVEWVCSLGDRALQPKTIKGYLAAVRSLHVDEGLSFSACESETVQRVIRGIKRYHGERERNPKQPITLEILQRLASVAGDTSNSFEASFDAAFKMAWAGFLRCGEFTLNRGEKFSPISHLTRGCITFLPSFESPSHVRIDLPASKTDPFRKGVSILLARAPPNSPTCPVSALHNLFLVDQKPHNAPLFTNPDGSPLSRDVFISKLKQRLLDCNVDPSRFSGHSFHRGAATAAAAVGYTEHEIQLLGRWRSDAYKLYIDIPASGF
ncbi:Integrase/recombinase xerD like protein [Termitomyces sp. J132]|nr:Integrase/recombinase xerD like protein [Termitomyces sp. J132]